MSSIDDFSNGLTITMLFPLWRQCKKFLPFTTTKTSKCWSLVVHNRTGATFVSTNLQIKNTISSQMHSGTVGEKSRRCSSWSFYRFYTQRNCWWNFYFKSYKYMQMNCVDWCQPTKSQLEVRRVNSCPTVFMRVEISSQREVDSHLTKTRPVALKRWSRPVVNEQNQSAESRTFKEQADRRKFNASVLMSSVLIATLCSRQGAAATTFVLGKNFNLLSLKRIFNVVIKREGARWIERMLQTRKKLHCHWNMGVWILESVHYRW